jgi:hypothetical protein
MILRTRPGRPAARQCRLAIAGVVVDDGEVARALLDQRLGQLVGQAGGAEAADHHGGAVGHCTRTILYHHRLAQHLAQFCSNFPRIGIWTRPRRKGRNDAD